MSCRFCQFFSCSNRRRIKTVFYGTKYPLCRSVQWGTQNANGEPTPWKWTYPCSFQSNPKGITATRLGGRNCFSEIMQTITESYLTWIDQNYQGSTGAGDTINFIAVGW